MSNPVPPGTRVQKIDAYDATVFLVGALALLTVGSSSRSLYRYPSAVSRRFEFVHRLVNQDPREVLIICRWSSLQ